jgi:hypothetical protein
MAWQLMKGIMVRVGSFAKSASFRKGKASALSVAKLVRRLTSSELDYAERPPIVVNSLPKSGTHLLLQVMLSLPGYSSYGGFVATTPTLTMHRRSDATLSQRIARLVPGEVCGAHIYYSDRIVEAFRQRGAVSIFIYRDPRDVFWSEMQYLLTMNRWHRAGRRARQISDLDDRFAFFLHGNKRSFRLGFEWPNFARRIEPYLGWLTEPETTSCTYEDLTNPVRVSAAVDSLVACLRASVPIVGQRDPETIAANMLGAIRPEASHTFRSGKKHEWRTGLTPSQIAELEAEVACLLPRM